MAAVSAPDGRLKRGDRRGKLTCLGPAPTPKFCNDGPNRWAWFHCECGTVKRMRRNAVGPGRSSSCGCQTQLGWRRQMLANVRESRARRRA